MIGYFWIVITFASHVHYIYIVFPMFLNNYLCDEEELMGRIDNLD
jgi:ABC-type polysaccharide/polyol phosphate export permease